MFLVSFLEGDRTLHSMPCADQCSWFGKARLEVDFDGEAAAPTESTPSEPAPHPRRRRRRRARGAAQLSLPHQLLLEVMLENLFDPLGDLWSTIVLHQMGSTLSSLLAGLQCSPLPASIWMVLLLPCPPGPHLLPMGPSIALYYISLLSGLGNNYMGPYATLQTTSPQSFCSRKEYLMI